MSGRFTARTELFGKVGAASRRSAPGSGGAGAPRVSQSGAADLIEKDNDRQLAALHNQVGALHSTVVGVRDTVSGQDTLLNSLGQGADTAKGLLNGTMRALDRVAGGGAGSGSNLCCVVGIMVVGFLLIYFLLLR